jgi:gamma-glutamyltranspeptidase/glutathione hydrolase
MPRAGILTATVPGTVWGWQEVLDKYGTLTFKQVLEPAASYASQGDCRQGKGAGGHNVP